MADVSVSWYTWLEQGRDIRVSADVLERVCRALELDENQREYLFALAHNRPAPLMPIKAADSYKVTPLLWRTLEALTVPALVLTYRWDVVAWNRIMLHLRDYSKLQPACRNLLRLLVNDPIHRRDARQYDRMVQLATSTLRADYSQVSDDPVLDELIEELSSACPIFKRHWQEPNQIPAAQDGDIVRYREFGNLAFNHSAYIPKGEPHVRVVIYVPADAESARHVASLVKRVAAEKEEAGTLARAGSRVNGSGNTASYESH